jgi:hypothetical protein
MTSPAADHAKKLAKLLREDLATAGIEIPHSLALELIAPQLGTKDWNVLAAPASRAGSAATPDISAGVPVLRDTCTYRGTAVPLYVQVSRSSAVLHLSEHHGDGGPNGAVSGSDRPDSTSPLLVMRPGAMACVSYRSHLVGPTVGGPVIPPQNPACHAARKGAKVDFERVEPAGRRSSGES